MGSQSVKSLVRSAVDDVRGDAVVIGASVGGVSEFACRGDLAGSFVDEHTVFYGASLTKQFVGVAVARAAIDGALDADSSVVAWIPELPSSMAPVRLQHLIHHTSGLPDVADPARGVPVDNGAVVDRFRLIVELSVEPGACYAYNNAGYVLLAEAVSRSLDRPVTEIANSLLHNAGLTDSRVGGPTVGLPGRPDPPGTIGDGGLWTSARDLVTWLEVCNSAAFGAEVHDLAESTITLVDGSSVDYAWGVRVTPSPLGSIITHGGSWDRWLAKTVRIRDRQVVVAVLSVGASELEVSRAGTELATAIARGSRG